MKKKIIASLSAVFISGTLSPASGFAGSPEGVTAGAGIGYYNFDSDRNLDNDILGSLSLGYQFASPWAVELLYLNADTDADSGVDVDVSQWRLDTLYHFDRDGNWQPYAAVGLGRMETEPPGSSHDATIANLGGGIKYMINSALSVRTDLRLINSLDHEFTDLALTVGINYLFAQSSEQPVAAAEPEPVGDADNDGVNDTMDQCPNTATGVAVDSVGCVLDSDNDGVANTFDQCPNSAAGAKVDSKGCYEVLTETREVQLSVNFANNSADVNSNDYGEIEKVAVFMREYPQTQVVIEGHTDDRGNADYNQQLSERRAKAVAQVLIDQFSINQSRVSAIGYGEQQPLVSNDTAEQRAQNRRVVAVVKATTQTTRY